MTITVVPILIGFFVGAILALTGAGGAILSVPLLVFFLGLSVPEAAPIALFSLMLTAGIAAMIGIKKGLVRYKSATLMAVIGIAMAPVGVMLSRILSVTWLSILFAMVLMVVAIRMWVLTMQSRQAQDARERIFFTQQPVHVAQDKSAPACQINPITSTLFWTAPCAARLAGTGMMTGLLSGLLGVGGGFVIVPALRAVSDFSDTTIVATSLAVVAFVSAAGFAAYAYTSHIEWSLALTFAMGTMLGLLSIQAVAARIPSYIGQYIFALLAFLMGLQMLARHIMPLFHP